MDINPNPIQPNPNVGAPVPQEQVTFFNAIQMGFNQYCKFSGRASRSEYWWWTLFTFIVGFVTSFVPYLSIFASLALLLPCLGVCCRRLHDIGKAAGWIFLALIPLVGAIILIVWYCRPSQPFPNRFGDVPNCPAV